MYGGERVAAVIVAAGEGRRMRAGLPKQFMEIGGRPVLAMAAEAFGENALVDDLLVVAEGARVDECRELLLSRAGRGAAAKLRAVAPGGATRQESVFAGLSALPGGVGLVLIHDAARPFVSQGCIERVIRAAAEDGAATAAVPVSDTVKLARGGRVSATLDREGVYAAQTPQGFRRDLIVRAHESALADGYEGTDDACLVERLLADVRVSEGDRGNIKLTVPEDMAMGEGLAALRGAGGEGAALSVGFGYDAHRFAEGRALVLGGVEIAHGRGLLGHSDADVLIHALMDALLGAAAMGDIGGMFPDSDPKYAGASSLGLLAQVAYALRREGFRLQNADITVAAERPRLAPHIGLMRERMAGAMGADPARLNIKATTSEGMGFVGREEGIAAYATALLAKNSGPDQGYPKEE
ncbi:MAG: 2-C-methyl-D-erythritol 4-phosphate cytidylyltransferase [Clostridiales Family XIII bacterium]|jgi:2-C-methyl-D-erythritol 4-phosphate cytidylyltransferase/2-C-methyl-D-erythritol 2,4-cyclodiphosphate synthase|nr:2-C-methyl-D-erythritol 4-phosphate cytidylyltransferase [Clostridiales Family XIII bacterium]